MSQGKVTDFFSARKRNASAQPSKRRKIEITSNEVDVSAFTKTNTNPYRNLTQDVNEVETMDSRKENTVFSPLQTRASRKAKTIKISTTKASSTRSRKPKTDSKQKLISQSFPQPPDAAEKGIGKVSQVTDDVTSSWDEHDGPTLTPSKSNNESAETGKRARGGKTAKKKSSSSDEATPEKRQQSQAVEPTNTKARKKLVLKQTSKEKTTATTETPNKNIAEFVMPKTPPPVSPLPPTPEHTVAMQKPAVKMSASVAAAIDKCKSLSAKTSKAKAAKVSSEDMKKKLAKIGNLSELKGQLAKMKETKDKLKAPVPSLKEFDKVEIEAEVPIETKLKVPAYERFHHLATAGTPTLSLPYKYRLLVEQFRGMDTVVSMLHNRNEICTFSKLKAAVQELTKRNFETSNVGQIKTVYPTAYELRQEKGLQNVQGFKQAGYQLTVEAKLEDKDADKGPRSIFKASHLLTRRSVFHNCLIHIVKQHHKEFLSKLSRPLSIPDDKITRWHPKFPLDEVPDIITSHLPQPPNVQVYQTAKDVLKSTMGKLSPKVENALRATAQEAEKVTPKPLSATPSKCAPATGAMKGIPQSLLEKIRAREAANAAASLMRDPKEEKRVVMMKRLPEIMRIIRSQFVTEKKPSLLIESVVQRVIDSYKSCIAPGDVEPHINLCIELLPEWISLIQIKKGKYVKIDKNIDLQVLTDKVNNILKGKK